MHRWFSRQGFHQFIDVFEFLERSPTDVAFAPVEPRREPNRERFGEIFVRTTLCVPVLKMHAVAAPAGARPGSARRFLTGRLSQKLLPFLRSSEPIRVHVRATRLVFH